MTVDAGEDWFGQQLAEFLAAISAYDDETAALGGAVELVAEAVAAEVVGLVRDGEVVACVGFPRGRTPAQAILDLVAAGQGSLAVPGAGTCHAMVCAVDTARPTSLVVARSEVAFDAQELALIRAMARVLQLGLRGIRNLHDERALRRESERQAAENAGLLATLRRRQALMERLSRIQRSISHRAPIDEVLDAISEGAADLLGAEVVGLRLLDRDDPTTLRLVSSVGVDPRIADSLRLSEIGKGVGGRCIAERRLVVTHDYAQSPRPHTAFIDSGLTAAMAAPVYQDGEPIGSLTVATRRTGVRFDPAEQEILLAFAEHTSLALNDAAAVEALRRAFNEALHQASHDTLTGLPNRSLVLDRLQQAIARAGRTGGSVGVLFVDLDRFKAVNDTLGHPTGDALLREIGSRLRRAVRPGDTVGRLAGDEFVVVCDDAPVEELLGIADHVADAIAAPVALIGRDRVITASIGVAVASRGAAPEELLRDADVAMYRAKERGRARVELFDQSIKARLFERLETEQALRRAIDGGEFRLQFQPVVRAATGALIGFEALVRWERPGHGLVPPNQFIGVAEDTGLILPLGAWVLDAACRQLGAWRAAHPLLGTLGVSVNLSARQFVDPDLAGRVEAALCKAHIPADSLTLEITESVLMEEAEATVATLQDLKALGVRLSVDDFGTGYSSLSYLKRFPVDALKIDRSFVDGVDSDAEDEVIVSAVASLAHALGLQVVAEGVERPAQLRRLLAIGCDYLQGFLLAAPAPSATFEPWLQRASGDAAAGLVAVTSVPSGSGVALGDTHR